MAVEVDARPKVVAYLSERWTSIAADVADIMADTHAAVTAAWEDGRESDVAPLEAILSAVATELATTVDPANPLTVQWYCDLVAPQKSPQNSD